MKYQAYVISHGGNVRTNNEDNAYLNGHYRRDDRIFSWDYENQMDNYVLAMVFDGMGGEEDGEVASRLAAEILAGMDTGKFSEIVNEYTEKSSEQLAYYAQNKDMGTTYAAVSIENNQYHFYNLGDSRGYLYRQNNLTQMTQDHNLVWKMYREGLLTKKQAQSHPARHAIYQFLGMKEEGEIIKPECYQAAVLQADRGDICLLCTDGLTEMVREEQIVQVLQENHTIKDKANILLKMALEAGGKDNITIVLLTSAL